MTIGTELEQGETRVRCPRPVHALGKAWVGLRAAISRPWGGVLGCIGCRLRERVPGAVLAPQPCRERADHHGLRGCIKVSIWQQGKSNASAYDAKYFQAKVPQDVPMTTQERAYTSPIWYTPGT